MTITKFAIIKHATTKIYHYKKFANIKKKFQLQKINITTTNHNYKL